MVSLDVGILRAGLPSLLVHTDLSIVFFLIHICIKHSLVYIPPPPSSFVTGFCAFEIEQRLALHGSLYVVVCRYIWSLLRT